MRTAQEEYERIKRYATPFKDIGNYEMTANEMTALLTCSPDMWRLMSLAFRFGFEKGCRKTKKAVKS